MTNPTISHSTPPVADTAWRPLARALADQLARDGDLHDPRWTDALLAIPRHEFVPRYYEQELAGTPRRWIPHEPADQASTQRWLELVYSPTTLITELAELAGRGVQAPVSSSTKPDLMIRMLEQLDLGDGMRVLEIGTGTGYNTALLCHRLGAGNVVSIDIDPRLVETARTRLRHLGHTPTLLAGDGAAGDPAHGPYDRIIATCSLFGVPPPWIDQVRPGGLVLAHVEGPLGAGNLALLHRQPDEPAFVGRFLPWWGCFMRRRATAGTTVEIPRPARASEPPTGRTTCLDPAQLDGGQAFTFLAQLALSPGTYRAITLHSGTPVTELRTPDGSWCHINRSPDPDGRYHVREAGHTPILARLEHSWAQWRDLGAPAWHRFGITAAHTTQHIWLDDPTHGPTWPLPAPPG